MGPSAKEDVGGDREGMRVKVSKGPIGQVHVAVLGFLRGTGVGCMINIRRIPREEGGEEGEGETNEEDGPGPP